MIETNQTTVFCENVKIKIIKDYTIKLYFYI